MWVNAGDGGDGVHTIGQANTAVLDRRKMGMTR
jgi:hypothetical protein